MRLRVRLAGIGPTWMSGYFSAPTTTTDTVHVLLPGATYRAVYWNWPGAQSEASYVRAALSAGAASLALDPLGVGESGHPPSDLLRLSRQAEGLKHVIRGLRSGTVVGQSFSRVIFIGHSLGCSYAWIAAQGDPEIDAFVLTGQLHHGRESFFEPFQASLYPAREEPSLVSQAPDDGYVTTRPGTRAGLFHHRDTAVVRNVRLDERLKSTVSASELADSAPLITGPDPDQAPSRAIKAPTLIVVGDHDAVWCGGSDGLAPNPRSIQQAERPYYAEQARLKVRVIPDTGHSLMLHSTAAATTKEILDWLAGL